MIAIRLIERADDEDESVKVSSTSGQLTPRRSKVADHPFGINAGPRRQDD